MFVGVPTLTVSQSAAALYIFFSTHDEEKAVEWVKGSGHGWWTEFLQGKWGVVVEIDRDWFSLIIFLRDEMKMGMFLIILREQETLTHRICSFSVLNCQTLSGRMNGTILPGFSACLSEVCVLRGFPRRASSTVCPQKSWTLSQWWKRA